MVQFGEGRGLARPVAWLSVAAARGAVAAACGDAVPAGSGAALLSVEGAGAGAAADAVAGRLSGASGSSAGKPCASRIRLK